MVNKWEIYFCSLDPVQGSEQRGMRPVLIISNNAVNHNLPVSTVLPFSSIKTGSKIYPTEVSLSTEATGLQKPSVAMIHQIRTVSHNRLLNKIGDVDDIEIREKILQACRNYFEI